MKGHVPTPSGLVDTMVEMAFRERLPTPADTVVDAGCGSGAFIEGILRFCRRMRIEPPRIVGIELNPALVAVARRRFATVAKVAVLHRDYLSGNAPSADFVVGNPPYVSLASLRPDERDKLRNGFQSATGRFDLYMLFFEQALRHLKPGGTLCFVTPEKFEYVASATKLRTLLTTNRVQEILHVAENTFEDFVTYPAISLIRKGGKGLTRILLRDGTRRDVLLPTNGAPWGASIRGAAKDPEPAATLEDVCVRISCGIATGCDDVYVMSRADLPRSFHRFAHPTISGKQLGVVPLENPADVLLVPYGSEGLVASENALQDFGIYLQRPSNRRRLVARSCVRMGGKKWYAFHDSTDIRGLTVEKILCKDVAPHARFWHDASGKIVPRHSVYYLIPKPGVNVSRLLAYLNSDSVRAWISNNSQRAANDFVRLQTTTLKKVPIPPSILEGLLPPLPFEVSPVAPLQTAAGIQES